MKLVELLATELEDWPTSDAIHDARYVTQDCGGLLNALDHGCNATQDMLEINNEGLWGAEYLSYALDRNTDTVIELDHVAEDYACAIVTKEEWLAEKKRLSGKTSVDNTTSQTVESLQQIEEEGFKMLSAEQIVARVKEIDTLQKEMQNERDTLVKQLAEKGLALIVENQKTDAHWIEWKAGDFVKVVSSIISHHSIPLGTMTAIERVDRHNDKRRFIVCDEWVSPDELIWVGCQ